MLGGCTGKVLNPGSCSEAQNSYIEKPSCFNSEGGIKLIQKSGTCWGRNSLTGTKMNKDKERDDFEDCHNMKTETKLIRREMGKIKLKR